MVSKNLLLQSENYFFIFISFSVLLCFCGNFFLRIIASEEYSTSFVMYLLLGISTLFFMLFNSASIIPKACNRINILLVISIISCILITPVANLSLKIWGFMDYLLLLLCFGGILLGYALANEENYK